MSKDPIEKARASWGEDAPDWVLGLAAECAKSSQNRVAVKLEVSAAMISYVLGKKYKGDLDGLEQRYRGAYERKTLQCPALGDLTLDKCRRWRERSKHLRNANALGVTMFRACNACPVNLRDKEEP